MNTKDARFMRKLVDRWPALPQRTRVKIYKLVMASIAVKDGMATPAQKALITRVNRELAAKRGTAKKQ